MNPVSTCENCNRTIGFLEQVKITRKSRVCLECFNRLEYESKPKPAPYVPPHLPQIEPRPADLERPDLWRPMTPDEAADWLRLRDLGYEDPVQTVLHLRETGQIIKRKIAGRTAFTLPDLVQYVMRATTDKGERG